MSHQQDQTRSVLPDDQPPASTSSNNQNPLAGPKPAGKTMAVQPYIGSGGSKAYSHCHETCDAAKMSEEEYNEQVQKTLKSDCYFFSGCADSQTSSDVYDLSKGFPKINPATPSVKSGGACTNALLSVLAERPTIGYGDLLCSARAKLKELKYTQVPQLSTSRRINLKSTNFSVNNPHDVDGKGKRRALIIAINYTGTDGELSGCVNDAKAWRAYLESQGWDVNDPSVCRVLTDDATFTYSNQMPTAANILAGMQWLVKDAQPMDSLWISCSSHGTQLPVEDPDENEEADGYDEALVPLDFEENGFIRDDVIFKTLVLPLPEHVNFVGVFDMCHSGTLCDLAFSLVATDENIKKYQAGELDQMLASAIFDLKATEKKVKELANGAFDAMKNISRSVYRRTCRFRCIC